MGHTRAEAPRVDPEPMGFLGGSRNDSTAPQMSVNPTAESAAIGTACVDCRRDHALEYLPGCPDCGGPLVVRYDFDRLAGTDLAALDGPGIWRYAPFLPIADATHRVTLAEGDTPLLRAPGLGAELGLDDLWLKFEGANPTGSMKDRTSATSVAASLRFGFERIGTVSSGNMGSSIAGYAARAGLRAFVFAAPYSSPTQRLHMSSGTPDFYLYDGPFDAMAQAFTSVAADGAIFDGGTSLNAFNAEGHKTIAYEIFQQLGGRAPDFAVYPVGAADLLLSVQRGFEELRELGHAAHVPTRVAAQSEACDPLVRALHDGGELESQTARASVAGGVIVGDMGRKGAYALRQLREFRGLGATASDDQIQEWQTRLARLEGIWAGPTACVVLPALANLTTAGQIPRDAQVVCVLSETGLKSDPPPHDYATIEPTEAALRVVLEP